MALWTMISKFRTVALTLAAAGVFIAITAGAPLDANASLMVTVTYETDGGTHTESCVDNDISGCDLDPTVGSIFFLSSHENWSNTIEVGTSKPVIGSSEEAAMSLTVSALSNGSNTKDSTMTVELTDTFNEPTGDRYWATSTISGAWAEQVDYETSVEDGAYTVLTSATFDPLSGGGTLYGGTMGVVDPYTLSLTTTLYAAAYTTVSGAVTTTLTVVISEPRSLALFGTGLLLLGFLTHGWTRRSRAPVRH